MKLSLISESIKQSDLFDFYILVYAYYENLPNHSDIEKYLKFVGQKIVLDHLDQLGNIICNRYSPVRSPDRYRRTFEKYGLDYKNPDLDSLDIIGFEKLSIDQKQQYLMDIFRIIKPEDLGWFTSDKGTWYKLARWYSGVVIPNSIDGIISLIDKIHNTFHHGGLITDYMDESEWIEQALHIRNAGSPSQLLQYTSPTVRQLVARSTFIGDKRGTITDLEKLNVAFNKIRTKNIEIGESHNNSLIVNGEFYELSFFKKDSNEWSPLFVFAQIPTTHIENIKNGVLKITNQGQFTVKIQELIDKLSITLQNDTVNVSKPIERFMDLAQDIVNAGAASAAGREQHIGSGIGQIKEHYRVRRKQ